MKVASIRQLQDWETQRIFAQQSPTSPMGDDRNARLLVSHTLSDGQRWSIVPFLLRRPDYVGQASRRYRKIQARRYGGQAGTSSPGTILSP